MEVGNESAQDKAARRRTRRMQHLIPDEALRRSPRIRRSGIPPFYGPTPRRTSREASLATDDDASSVASSGSRRSRSSRRSSRASEMLNESGQVLYEESESEADQDVTVVSSTHYAAACVHHRVAYQGQQVDQALGQLVRSPRSLNSGDSGVASGNEWVVRSAAGEAAQQRRNEDHLVEGGVEGQVDLPPHLFGPDSDGEVDGTQVARYRFKKERILLPPPPSPSALAALLLFLKRVASFPYLCLVSLLTFDLLLLERLSLLLAITTNPVQKKKSWFGLLVLLLALLGLTWWLTLIAVANPPPAPNCTNSCLSTEDLETLRHSVLSEMRNSSAVSRVELLQWLQGNLTQLRETQDRLATDMGRVEATSDTRYSEVSVRMVQHSEALAGVSAVTERLKALLLQLEGLEQQVDLLQDSNQSTHAHLEQLQVEVSGALDRGQQLKGELADLKNKCCGEGVTVEEVSTVVHQELGKMLDKDGGVFGTWLQTQMVGVVRQEDFDKFNASLRGLVIRWIKQDGGLSRLKVEDMILEALTLYDADRTGKFDYALETAGGSIPHALCSETYTPSASTVQLFGYTVWQYSNSARTVIQPGVLPGQCWAFPGDQGYVVIKLAASISLTEVTVEHLPKSLSPTGKIDSAPKNFSLYVGESEEEERQFVGDYVYTGDEPRETIPVKACDRVVRYVEFRFHSNHGNENYTCVYRLRVHGHLPSTEGQS